MFLSIVTPSRFLFICFFTMVSVFTSCKKEDIAVPDPITFIPVIEVIETQEVVVYIDKSCSSCDFVIEENEWQFDGSKYTESAGLGYVMSPGDTIGITGGTDGKREGLNIINAVGTKDKPIVFINCDGRVELGSDKNVSKGIDIGSSRYIKLAGAGNIASEYGLALRGFMGLEIAGSSSDYEVYAIEILEAGYAGITARTDAACDGSVGIDFTQYNTILHHNYVHDTEGEGFYVGGSHWNAGQTEQPGCVGQLIFEPQLEGVRIYSNKVYNTGRDGIQVGSAIEDCEIYGNYIENFGLRKEEGHMTGFQINPGTTGKLYNNIVNGGNGFGIFMVGQGGNLVYNNLIINPTYDGVYVDERLKDDSDREWYFRFINNTIINPGYNGFGFNSGNTKGNEIINNLITTPGVNFFDGYDNYKNSNNILNDDSEVLKFVDITELDYSSPNVNTGMDVSSYGIEIDINGKARPSNSYDVGAFQY